MTAERQALVEFCQSNARQLRVAAETIYPPEVASNMLVAAQRYDQLAALASPPPADGDARLRELVIKWRDLVTDLDRHHDTRKADTLESCADQLQDILDAPLSAPAPAPPAQELCLSCNGNTVVKIAGGTMACSRCGQTGYEPAQASPTREQVEALKTWEAGLAGMYPIRFARYVLLADVLALYGPTREPLSPASPTQAQIEALRDRRGWTTDAERQQWHGWREAFAAVLALYSPDAAAPRGQAQEQADGE